MARKQAQKTPATGKSSTKFDPPSQVSPIGEEPPEDSRMIIGASAEQDDSERDAIEVTAYYLAEKRGFKPGQELEDWIRAEKIVKQQDSHT